MAHYDIESLSYDDWYETSIGKFIDNLQTQLVFEKLDPKPGMKILDVGCGTGNFSIKLATMGCEIIGVDVSDGMLDKAKLKAGELPVQFLKMNAAALNFDDAYFDAVFSVTAFEFIKDNQMAFDEMMRVAKPGASVVVGTLHKDSAWGSLYASKNMKEQSIFKYAKLKSMADLKTYNLQKLISIDACLHVNPSFVESDFTIENELRLKSTNPGGFICGLWKK